MDGGEQPSCGLKTLSAELATTSYDLTPRNLYQTVVNYAKEQSAKSSLLTYNCWIHTIDSRPVSISIVHLLATCTEVAGYAWYPAAQCTPEPSVQGWSYPGPSAGPVWEVVHEVTIHHTDHLHDFDVWHWHFVSGVFSFLLAAWLTLKEVVRRYLLR